MRQRRGTVPAMAPAMRLNVVRQIQADDRELQAQIVAVLLDIQSAAARATSALDRGDLSDLATIGRYLTLAGATLTHLVTVR